MLVGHQQYYCHQIHDFASKKVRCFSREFGRRRLTWYLYLSFGVRASVTCTPVSLKHHHAGSIRQLLGLALRRQKKSLSVLVKSAIFLFNIDRDNAILGRPGKRQLHELASSVIRHPSVSNLSDVEEDREPDLSWTECRSEHKDLSLAYSESTTPYASFRPPPSLDSFVTTAPHYPNHPAIITPLTSSGENLPSAELSSRQAPR